MSMEPSEQDREDFRKYTLWFAYLCIIYSIIGFSWGALMGGIKALREFVDYSAYGHKIVLAHTHINLLGWVEMAIFAALYYIVPLLAKRPIHSVRLVKVHFWMHNFGLVGLVVFFTMAGMVGALPNDGGDPDAPAHLYHYLMRYTGFFGSLVLLANIIWGYNLFRTAAGWKNRP